jgi:5-methylcytosine-specific restriction endonuclease McrA
MNSIKGKNYTVTRIHITKAIELLQLPNFQRDISTERTKHFVDTLNEYAEETGDIYEFPPILVGELNGVLYVIDGQHRFIAYKKFFDDIDINDPEQKDIINSFEIFITIRTVSDEIELKTYFSVVNNHYITTGLNTNINEMDCIALLKNYIKNVYPEFISHAQKPRFPNINIDSFASFCLQKGIRTQEKLIQLNEHTKDVIPIQKKLKIESKSPSNPLYLTWVYDEENKQPKKNRSITPQIRNQLWETYNGRSMDGICFVCGCEIKYESFEAAHVIPASKNGLDEINNLRCTCQTCNRFMGDTNLNDFKEKFYININQVLQSSQVQHSNSEVSH